MQTKTIQIDREKAKELYRAYREHQHWSEPIDEEIMRTYRAIAQGRMVIQALESIKVAGVGADGFPKLAIARADQKRQNCTIYNNGSASMGRSPQRGSRLSTFHFEWPEGSFIGQRKSWRAEAIVPIIPLNLRPKRALENYHILWEAEWSNIVPHDPFLLRRLGRGDLWIVLAQWDLTEVERAALQTLVNSA